MAKAKAPKDKTEEQAQVALYNEEGIIQLTASKIDAWKAKGEEALVVAEKMVVQDEESYTKAIGVLSEIKAETTAIELVRTGIGAPIFKIVTRINAMCKTIATPFGEADAKIRRKALKFQADKDAAIRLENERIRKEAEDRERKALMQSAKKGTPPPAPAPVPDYIPPPEKTTTTETGAAGTVKKPWDFEIENESLIPREYLMPNEKFIRAAVTSGKRVIPGVRIFEKPSLSIRS